MKENIDLTLGRYQLISLLGRGGMAEVYKAYQPSLDRYVAVKILHPHLADEPGFVSRFEREAAFVARLRHPNIVQVIDFDCQDERYYMVMEFIEGASLKVELDGRAEIGETYTPEEAACVISGVASALDYAHGRGMLHRDVKPGNILFTGEGQVVLADFGIAHIVGATLYTHSAGALGTPAYISPEQGRGERGDARSDIYSLGVVLYQMLTGRLPFEAETPLGLIQQHIEASLPSPRSVNPTLSQAVEAVLLKALAKDPAERFQRAGEMAHALLETVGLAPEQVSGAAAFPGILGTPQEIETSRKPSPATPDRGLFASREQEASSPPGGEDFIDQLVAAVEVKSQLFVARQKELKQLEDGLDRATRGEGCVYFVTGEPGSGKSALLAEFSRQALHKHPDLLLFWGQCNTYTGQGDPYFPFLNITRMLAGEVESLLTGGLITPENARRLWKFLPEAIASLLDYGPDLTNRFLSGGDRSSLARMHPGVRPNILERLKSQLEQLPQGQAQARLQQVALFEQFTQVVTALARHHPLILILDDLQWIDPGSASLLFHLGRRLAGHKIFILGAYRPEDVAMGREGEPHPLGGVVQELRAVYGEILVELAHSEGEDFVEAFLDSEPNELSRNFRQTLYQHTSGHPLFTIELLRGMQLRGEMVRNDQGNWVEASQLNWDELPARVEAVIARRIGYLPDECRELLNAACVEGEQFTTEVVAHVMGKNEQRVYDLLSQEIGKRHHLVAAQGLKQIGTQRLSFYRFQHSLFQTYLYNHLDVVEKAHLHGKIGDELEQVYSQDQDRFLENANTLARHFEAAGMAEKAVRYYAQAGKNALRLSANHEAIAHFYRALHLIKTLPASMDRDRQELDLQLSLGHPLTAVKGWAPPELAAAYERAQELCQNIGDHSRLFPVLWWLVMYRLGRSEHAELDRLDEQLTHLAQQSGDPALLSMAIPLVSPFYQGKFTEARKILERASATPDLSQQRTQAQNYGMAPAVVGLAYLSNCLWALGFPDQADQCSLEACALAEKVNHPLTSCYAISRSCWLAACRGDFDAMREPCEKLYQLTQKFGIKSFEFGAIFFENWANVYSGISADEGIEKMHQSIENYRAMGTVLNRTAFLVFFGQACGKVGQIQRGLEAVEESISLAEKTGERWYQAEAFRVKGELLVQQAEIHVQHKAELSEAEHCFRMARQIASQQQAKTLESRATESLSNLWQKQMESKPE